jgi:hypothetical protein
MPKNKSIELKKKRERRKKESESKRQKTIDSAKTQQTSDNK